MTTSSQLAYDEFNAQLAAIHAANRLAAASEEAIERRLAAAWFASHPEEDSGVQCAAINSARQG
jgi:hypothetical protein